ncbi:hypothetical protein [Corynebacterium sp.]|uniref:hypothetical protein n=1 Tax=Corynebacterium sp. TaxID=1720 RepID=UPI0026DAB430|nr:hypothetical protein [Corynebacterium sp.]MDO4914823.1 hypothetical protein [Corynebacterium sp.]
MTETNEIPEEIKKSFKEHEEKIEQIEKLQTNQSADFEKKIKALRQEVTRESSSLEANCTRLRREVEEAKSEVRESQKKTFNDVNIALGKTDQRCEDKIKEYEKKQNEKFKLLEEKVERLNQLDYAMWRDGTEAGRYFSQQWIPAARDWNLGYEELTKTWVRLVKQAEQEELGDPKNWEGEGWLPNAKETGQFYPKPQLKEEPQRPKIKPYDGENVDYLGAFWKAAIIGGILVAIALLVMSTVLNSITDGWWGSRLHNGLSWLLLLIVIVVAVLCGFINKKVAADNNQAEYNAQTEKLLQKYKNQRKYVKNFNNNLEKQWEQQERKARSDLHKKIDRKVGVDREKSGWESDWASVPTREQFVGITRMLKSPEKVAPAYAELPRLNEYQLNDQMPARYKYWMNLSREGLQNNGIRSL